MLKEEMFIRKYVIGVDLGGTKIATAISDNQGRILHRIILPTEVEGGVDRVLGDIGDTIREALNEVGASREDVIGIGIGSPGPLDPDAGVIIFAPNLKWHNVPIKARIEEEFQIPVLLENDANLAGFGEARFGAGRGAENIVYMTVSTGIGGGIIINGEIYRGSSSVAGEIGHMTILPDGPRCGCGNYGCLEALASGTAIARMANERIAKGAKTAIVRLAHGGEVTSAHVGKAALDGDEVALEIIEMAATYLGIGISNLINILNPEVIIIGGGVSQMGEPLFARVRKTVKERAIGPAFKAVRIVPAALGQDAGVVGAIALILKR